MRDVEAGEIMHPGVGPLVEAERLYVEQSRLAARLTESAPSLTLFDVGLGAASNARAAWLVSARAPASAARLQLVSFERDLGALALALEHAEDFGLDGEVGLAARALLSSGEHDTARTHWRLRHGDLLSALAVEKLRADLVFWDPFSPRANPTLWTVTAFAALAAVAAPDCMVLTYSASTRTRAAMLLAGWSVGIGDSIGEKNQTTVAALDTALLARPLDRAWLRRLSLPGAPLPADAPEDAPAVIAAHSQFKAG
jgi:queuine tRNA-ribosyltransferase